MENRVFVVSGYFFAWFVCQWTENGIYDCAGGFEGIPIDKGNADPVGGTDQTIPFGT